MAFYSRALIAVRPREPHDPGSAHTTCLKACATKLVATLFQGRAGLRLKAFGIFKQSARQAGVPKKTRSVIHARTIWEDEWLMGRAVHISATLCLSPSLRTKTVGNQTSVANRLGARTNRRRASRVRTTSLEAIDNGAEHRELHDVRLGLSRGLEPSSQNVYRVGVSRKDNEDRA